MKELKISNSRITTYRRCHRAHYYKYVMKIIKKKKSGALQRGSIIHECIENFNNGKSWIKPFNKFEKEFFQNTFAEERVELGDIPGMVRELMENYAYWSEKYEDLNYIQNELEFNIPLTTSITFNGFIDALVSDPKDKIWSLERKTYSKEADRDFLMFNNQSAIYNWALDQLGYNSSGTLWEIIKAKTPSKPKLTKKGILSKAALDSTPYTVRKSLRELGLNPKEYTDFINTFSFDDFFKRDYIRINPKVVKSIMNDCKTTALDIQQRGEEVKDRNLSRECSFCDYKAICQADIMGLDSSFIIKKDYKIKEDDENNGKHKKEQNQHK